MKKDKQQYFNQLGEKTFNEYMSQYDVKRRKNLIFSQLLKNKKLKDKKVLEIGCGTGQFSIEIQDRSKSLTVLDIGPDLVKNVSNTLGCIGTAGDATDLPFPDNSFEMIISSECIEHTPDPENAINEMCRVCKPEGFICFTTPNKLWYPLLFLANLFGIRKFSGIENWIFPHRAKAILKQNAMRDIIFSGCHLWPFQLKFTRSILSRSDKYGKRLYPLMINFGVVAYKKQ